MFNIFLSMFFISAIDSESLKVILNKSDSLQMTQLEISKKYLRGENFTQNGVIYTVYPELIFKLNKEKFVNNNQFRNLLTTRDFTIYSKLDKENLNENINNIVVLNENTKNFGILSGNIIVKMKNDSSFQDNSLEIVKSYPMMNYYLVRIPKNLKIQDTIDKIKNNKNVREVMVEVLENFKESF